LFQFVSVNVERTWYVIDKVSKFLDNQPFEFNKTYQKWQLLKRSKSEEKKKSNQNEGVGEWCGDASKGGATPFPSIFPSQT